VTPLTDPPPAQVGFVAIGRNEGERLRRCLAALSACGGPLVYVDSGSTDGSCELARAAGALVVELDASEPFSAARARNAGFERLLREAPRTEFVQFVDGDCELREGWIAAGLRALQSPDVAVACGRRRERWPEASVYNRLCDVEWDTPVGEAQACGGDALVRVDAFRRAGGYDPRLIAGEEPELCLRLRRLGFRILRLDAEMTAHDAGLTRWTQWWRRAVRSGHATAALLALHGPTPEHRGLRRALSSIVWALVLPVGLVLVVAAAARGSNALAAAAAGAVVAAYALLLARVARGCRRRGRSSADARAYAWSCVLAKWPESCGLALYVLRRLSGSGNRLIEYKAGPAAPPGPRPTLGRRLRSGADRAARWSGVLASREREARDGLTVLMYHRVLDDARCAHYPFPALVMPVSAFRAQVRWLAGRGEVLPLAQALRRTMTVDPTRGRPLFALTFDDGYADAGEIVAGILEEAGVRGTFFVTTGFVGGGALWFDRAAQLFAALPERTRREVVIGGGVPVSDLPAAAADARAWTAVLKSLPPPRRDALLDALQREAGGAPPLEDFGGLSVAQLIAMHERGHEIGSHTVSHPVLTTLDDSAARREIADARAALAAWLGVDVPGFCYPNGDHDDRIAALVERAGHAYACSVRDGIHRPGDDPFRIRRVAVTADAVLDRTGRFEVTAFRRELCGLYRRRVRAPVEPRPA
jgi:peptidoglycan/xylan/chitin deacetylase (PgdA/CDA1 family)/GT2 family glycosyltransferase